MIAVSLLMALAMPSPQASIKAGHYAVSNFHIEIDGKSGGYLWRVQGGIPTHEPEIWIDSEGARHKRPGRAKFQNITMRGGTGMGKPVHDWIQSAMDKKYTRKGGKVTVVDYNHRNSTNSLEYGGALLTEIAFPALHGSSKETAFLKLSVSPESAKVSTKEPTKLDFPNFRLWGESQFEVEFPDFPDLRALQVSPVIVKFGWDPAREALVGADVENVTFTLSPGGMALVDPFFQEVLKGSERRTSVIIRYLLPDATLELTLTGACIVTLAPDRDPSFADLATATMEFLVEDFRYAVTHK